MSTVWDLELGTPADALPQNDYIDYACGTQGGPPSLPLRGWVEFARCAAEPSGLHEVYFRYDDEFRFDRVRVRPSGSVQQRGRAAIARRGAARADRRAHRQLV